MRLDLPRLRERFGAVLLYGMQTVYELDSGMIGDEIKVRRDAATQRVPYERLHDALSGMAVVVPIMGEKLKLVEGVLSGIPNPCQIIIVSNSPRTPIDRFQLEKEMAETFGAYTNRNVMCVHQKDPRVARAFEKAGYKDILGDDGLVRNGKAEGMIVGTLMAELAGRRSVAFVDSDNYFPGAVMEYCHIFAAGLAMARRQEYAMVRISWNSKPKVVDSSLYFSKWGRSSIVTNAHMNKLVSSHTGFETEVIKTGNAGEHAMTLDLAMTLGWSQGYSVEPNQLVYMFEQFGGVLEPENPALLSKAVNVYQIESRNPHMHESKGEEHVSKMIEASLSAIYHSPLANEQVKQAIEHELHTRDIRPKGDPIPVLRHYDPLNTMNVAAFREVLRGGGYGFETPSLEKIRPA